MCVFSIGVLAGLLTGLLGVGGGFVIVPALRKVSDLDMHSIVATSLLIIGLIGGFSILIHVLDGFHYPVTISLGFVSSCIVGMLIGRKMISLIPIKTVQKIFALTVFCVANYMLFKAVFWTGSAQQNGLGWSLTLLELHAHPHPVVASNIVELLTGRITKRRRTRFI